MSNRLLPACLLAAFALLAVCGCRKTSGGGEKKYRFTDTLRVGGMPRSYLLNLPPGYYSSSGFSLVIGLHGGGGSGLQFEASTKLTEKANAAGFIVAYPDGTGPIPTWNAGNCCGSAVSRQVDDVQFISDLIDHLVAAYSIDRKKVYVTGHSNGGMMAYRLACELSEKIAAAAPNAASLMVRTACNPARPVPLLHMHSRLDTNVPYRGGYGSGISGAYFPPLDSVFSVWSSNDGCTAPTIVSNNGYTLQKWNTCNAGSSIHYYLTDDGGHAWPGGLPGSVAGDPPSAVINANDLLWDFFQQYRLP